MFTVHVVVKVSPLARVSAVVGEVACALHPAGRLNSLRTLVMSADSLFTKVVVTWTVLPSIALPWVAMLAAAQAGTSAVVPRSSTRKLSIEKSFPDFPP